MTDQLTQQQVNQTAWAACDTFRGVVDAGQYKDYILVMLFLKYISDHWNDHLETYRKQYGGDETRIRRRLERERFVLPDAIKGNDDGQAFFGILEGALATDDGKTIEADEVAAIALTIIEIIKSHHIVDVWSNDIAQPPALPLA